MVRNVAAPMMIPVRLMLSENQCQQHPQPVGRDAGAESADGVGPDGLADELAVAQRVEHGGVGTQVAAPAHAHGSEDGDGVVGDDAVGDELGHQADGGSHGTQGGDGERDQRAALETEEPVEDDVDLVGQPGDDRHALVGHALVGAVGTRRAEGEHHYDGGDAEHAGDDGHADADAALAAVEHGVEEPLEDIALALERDVLFGALLLGDGAVEFGVAFQGEALHEAGADDAADDGSQQSHQGSFAEAQTRHEGYHHQAHAEGGAEVGERDELVFLEVAGEVVVLGQRDDGGVVGEEGHHGAQSRHAGQVVERLHQRPQDILHQAHHAELGEQLADGTHQHTDGHDVEHRLEQQVIGRLHEGVEHVRQCHAVGQEAEEGEEAHQKDEGLQTAAGGELQPARFAVALVRVGLMVAENLKRVNHREHAVQQVAVIVVAIVVLTHNSIS